MIQSLIPFADPSSHDLTFVHGLVDIVYFLYLEFLGYQLAKFKLPLHGHVCHGGNILVGADVTILDTNLNRLRALDAIYGPRLKTLYSSPQTLEDCLKKADQTDLFYEMVNRALKKNEVELNSTFEK